LLSFFNFKEKGNTVISSQPERPLFVQNFWVKSGEERGGDFFKKYIFLEKVIFPYARLFGHNTWEKSRGLNFGFL
jgi:hypothetical protein